MTIDPAIFEQNRAATQRIRALADLPVDQLNRPVGEHWTVAITLAHLAFWDLRTLFVLDQTERDGQVFTANSDVYANDFTLPLISAIPPREAARIALETAEKIDQRLINYPANLLEAVAAYNPRWVNRSLHRLDHLDEVEAALRSTP